MKVDEEIAKKELKYLKGLIIQFNKQPNIFTRTEITGATNALNILFNSAVDIHFSENDHNFLTFIKFYNGPNPLYTVSALASEIEIPVDSGLGRMLNA